MWGLAFDDWLVVEHALGVVCVGGCGVWCGCVLCAHTDGPEEVSVSKKKTKPEASSEKRRRKVRTGAMHKTREQLAADRSAGFSRRLMMATTHRTVTRTGRNGEPEKTVMNRAPGHTLDVSELRMLPARPPWGFPRPDMANERKKVAS